MHPVAAEAAEGRELLHAGERSESQGERRDGDPISEPNRETDSIAAAAGDRENDDGGRGEREGEGAGAGERGGEGIEEG